MPHADPELAREYSRRYHEEHRAAVLTQRREKYALNPESVLEQNRRWRESDPEWGRNYAKQFRQAHPEYDRHRRRDPRIRLADAWHSKILRAITGLVGRKRLPTKWRADSALAPVLGCDPEKLKAHFEAQFRPGMTWANRGTGGWEVDLIRPSTAFDLTDADQLRQCFHFTNLQPLWRADNQRKYNK